MKENSIEEDITRIKQRIEDVKEYIEYGLPYSEYLDLENSFDNILSDYKRVLQENEKLKAKLLDTLEGQKIIKEETPQYIKENYILKEKVKNMIKEKEWALENYDCDKSDYKQSQAIGAWDILQKLLKESEE